MILDINRQPSLILKMPPDITQPCQHTKYAILQTHSQQRHKSTYSYDSLSEHEMTTL